MSKTNEQKKWYVRYELFIAAVLACVFVGITLLSMGRSSVWHDEGYTAVLIENDYAGIIEKTALDVHPPLYYLALKTWSLVFGDSVSALRQFSMFCMLGAILITWRLIRKLYGKRAAMFALVFMAVGPFLVRYGQEMRMYGFAALLASIATWLYVDSLDHKKVDTKKAVAYGVVIAAGMYTQYFFVLVAATHILHALAIQRMSFVQRIVGLKKYLVSIVVAGVLFLPWVPTVLDQFTDVYGAFWIGPVGAETLTSTPIAMSALKKQFEMTGVEGLVAVLTLATIVVLFRQFLIKHKDKAPRVLLFSVVAPPVLLFLLSVPPFQSSYQDRYMSFFAPIFYSLIALGCLSLTKVRARVASAVFMLLVLGYGQWNNYWNGNNHGWQPRPYFTMSDVVDQIDSNAPVYNTSLWTFFDTRTTLRDRGFDNVNQLLLGEMPQKWKGNWSAIYNRPELITTTIPQSVQSFWLIDESGKDQYSGKELEAFYQQRSYYVSGYAKMTKFVRK